MTKFNPKEAKAVKVNNKFEHGEQVRMVFEVRRNCGGFHREVEEEIQVNLGGGGGKTETGESAVSFFS